MKYRVLYVLILALLAKPVNAQEAITPPQDYKRQFSLVLYGYQPFPLGLAYGDRSFYHQSLPGLVYKWYKGNGAFRIKAGIDKLIQGDKFSDCCGNIDHKINYIGGNLGFGYEYGVSLGKFRLYSGIDATVEFGKYNGYDLLQESFGEFVNSYEGMGIGVYLAPTVGVQYRLSKRVAISLESHFRLGRSTGTERITRIEHFGRQGLISYNPNDGVYFKLSPLQQFSIDFFW